MKIYEVAVDRAVCYTVTVEVPDDASLADIHAAGEATIERAVKYGSAYVHIDGPDIIKAQRSIPC